MVWSAGSTINCWSCHDDPGHSGGFALGDGQGDVWGDVSPPYPRHYTCDNCHANRASLHSTTTAHNNRIIDPACASCHRNSATGNLASDNDVDALHGVTSAVDCGICHNYNGTKVDASLVRLKVEQGINGTAISCLDCHTDKGVNHGNIDHVARGYVTGSGTTCVICHDPGTAANAFVSVTHQDNCALCHTTVPALQPGLPTGADATNPNLCTDCHTNGWETTHTLNTPDHTSLVQVETTDCASCHSDARH